MTTRPACARACVCTCTCYVHKDLVCVWYLVEAQSMAAVVLSGKNSEDGTGHRRLWEQIFS